MKRQLLTGWGPVFIIGDDPFSLRWISEHLEILKSLNALGLVVNVESVERMEVLQQRADGLLLLPVICDNFCANSAIKCLSGINHRDGNITMINNIITANNIVILKMVILFTAP